MNGGDYPLVQISPTGRSEATTLRQIYLSRCAANIEALQRELAGDLEKIILKCLRKEPVERYKSARALSQDIERYLKGEPVAAEPRFFDKIVEAFPANKKPIQNYICRFQRRKSVDSPQCQQNLYSFFS